MIRIQILGLGNSKHRQLSSNLHLAIESAGLPAEVVQITEVDEILGFKVHSIPAIVLEEKVVFEDGHSPTPSVEELRKLLASMAVAQ